MLYLYFNIIFLVNLFTFPNHLPFLFLYYNTFTTLKSFLNSHHNQMVNILDLPPSSLLFYQNDGLNYNSLFKFDKHSLSYLVLRDYLPISLYLISNAIMKFLPFLTLPHISYLLTLILTISTNY
jgi:hypothetical protein